MKTFVCNPNKKSFKVLKMIAIFLKIRGCTTFESECILVVYIVLILIFLRGIWTELFIVHFIISTSFCYNITLNNFACNNIAIYQVAKSICTYASDFDKYIIHTQRTWTIITKYRIAQRLAIFSRILIIIFYKADLMNDFKIKTSTFEECACKRERKLSRKATTTTYWRNIFLMCHKRSVCIKKPRKRKKSIWKIHQDVIISRIEGKFVASLTYWIQWKIKDCRSLLLQQPEVKSFSWNLMSY